MENLFESIPEEIKQKAAGLTSPEELLELAKAEGIDLSDEQLEAVSGGSIWDQCSIAKHGCSEYY